MLLGKQFGVSTVPLNTRMSLSFTLTNNSGSPKTTVTFEDVLPASMVIATPNGLQNPSGADITADAGTDTISFSTATMAAGEIVDFIVDVIVPSSGTYNNVSGLVSTTEDGPIADSQATASVIGLEPNQSVTWSLFRFDAKTREEEEA